MTLTASFLEKANKSHLHTVATPLPKEQPPAEDYEIDGRLGKFAAELIGSLLWVARCTRPDVSFAVAFLARFAAPGRWSVVADRYLERIIAYLACTRDYVLVQWLSPGDVLSVVTYTDADHAGCPFTARSTSGTCSYLIGESGSQALVSWSSHRQGCSAASTGEAEIVAVAEACRKSTMPLAELLSQMLARDVASKLLSDSAAAVSAADKGVTTMRYLRKNHRVSVGCVSGYVREVGIELIKTDGEDNVSDIFTKPLEGQRFAVLRTALGVIHREMVEASPPQLVSLAVMG